jgi:hypothetical protein
MAKAPVDRLSSVSPTQSASENTLTRVELDFLIFRPRLVHDLTYLNIRLLQPNEH